jgi:hypothetical protein
VVRADLERVVRAAPRVVRVRVEDMAAILTATRKLVSKKVKIAITQFFVAMASRASRIHHFLVAKYASHRSEP